MQREEEEVGVDSGGQERRRERTSFHTYDKRRGGGVRMGGAREKVKTKEEEGGDRQR